MSDDGHFKKTARALVAKPARSIMEINETPVRIRTGVY